MYSGVFALRIEDCETQGDGRASDLPLCGLLGFPSRNKLPGVGRLEGVFPVHNSYLLQMEGHCGEKLLEDSLPCSPLE